MLSFMRKKIFLLLCLFFVGWANLANSELIPEDEQMDIISKYSLIVPQTNTNAAFCPYSFKKMQDLLANQASPDQSAPLPDLSIDGIVSHNVFLSNKPINDKIKKMSDTSVYHDLEPATLQKANEEIYRLTNNLIEGKLQWDFDTTGFLAANVTYLKNKWLIQFEDVKNGMDFYHHDGSVKKVPAFRAINVSKMKVVSTSGYTVYVIPCKNKNQQMLIIEPYEGSRETPNTFLDSKGKWLDIIETARANAKPLDDAYDDMDFITFTMPEFTIKQQHNLTSHLPIPGEYGQANQDIFIKVDKNGVEAAAVTNVVSADSCASREKHIKINRAFAFLFTDNSTTLPLFMGAVYDPTEK